MAGWLSAFRSPHSYDKRNRWETSVVRIGLVSTKGSGLRASAIAAVALCSVLVSLHARAESDREYCERQQGPAKVICLRQFEKAASQPVAAAVPAAPQAESERAYCERQQGSARVVCMRQLDKAAAAPAVAVTTTTPSPTQNAAAPIANGSAAAAAPSGAALYKVIDGYHVDPGTLKGFQVWRSAACDRCHGANQEGMVGPSLINSLKTLSKEAFVETLTKGRLQLGMPSFGGNTDLTSNIDHLYAYLKGRSDGAITRARVEPMVQ